MVLISSVIFALRVGVGPVVGVRGMPSVTTAGRQRQLQVAETVDALIEDVATATALIRDHDAVQAQVSRKELGGPIAGGRSGGAEVPHACRQGLPPAARGGSSDLWQGQKPAEELSRGPRVASGTR